MSRGLRLLRRLLDAFTPPEPPLSAKPPAPGGGGSASGHGTRQPDTDEDYVEMAKERELRILMAHWL